MDAPANWEPAVTIECWSCALPSGGVAVAWEVTPPADLEVSRSDDGGPFVVVYRSIGDEVDLHDAEGRASSVYQITAAGLTMPCDVLPYEPGITAADVGLIVDESGNVTGRLDPPTDGFSA
jgi:hypothetical protein